MTKCSFCGAPDARLGHPNAVPYDPCVGEPICEACRNSLTLDDEEPEEAPAPRFAVNTSTRSFAWDADDRWHVIVRIGHDSWHADSSFSNLELAEDRTAFLRLGGADVELVMKNRCEFVEGSNVRDLVAEALVREAES